MDRALDVWMQVVETQSEGQSVTEAFQPWTITCQIHQHSRHDHSTQDLVFVVTLWAWCTGVDLPFSYVYSFFSFLCPSPLNFWAACFLLESVEENSCSSVRTNDLFASVTVRRMNILRVVWLNYKFGLHQIESESFQLIPQTENLCDGHPRFWIQ